MNLIAYGGTFVSARDLYDKIVAAIANVFSKEWDITIIDDSHAVLHSRGEGGLDDMYYMIEYNGGEDSVYMKGMQFYDFTNNTPSTYGLTNLPFYGIKKFDLSVFPGYFWIYGNADYLHIFYRGTGSSAVPEYLIPKLITIGKFIPSYSPAVTWVNQDEILPGVNVTVKVNNVAIFEVNRYVTISGFNTWEKSLVVAIDETASTITLASVVEHHQTLYDENGNIANPIIIGEMAKPYFIFQDSYYKQGAIIWASAMVFPRISGRALGLNAKDYGTNQGSGVRVDVFKAVRTLADASALDMLNYDRYLFEYYLYKLDGDNRGFYGKLPYLYAVGANDINSETTMICDNTYLYRCFYVYGLGMSAVRESNA